MANEKKPDTQQIMKAVSFRFNEIGTTAETALPVGTKNTAKAALEFVIAHQLKKLAEDRYKEAKKQAEAQGIFGAEDDYIPGATVTVWKGPGAPFQITVKKNKTAKLLDKDALHAILTEKLGAKEADAIIELAQKDRKGAVEIIPVLS